MKTQTVMPYPPLPPPVVLSNRLLLTQFSSVARTADWWNAAPETLTARATQVTVVLREILEQTAYRHGGIND